MEAAIESAAQQTAQDLKALIKQAGSSPTPAPSASGKENETQGGGEANAQTSSLHMTPALPTGKHSKRVTAG